MSVIDRAMYEHLKNWCDRKRPENQFMMYVNSRDRAITGSTIRKLMFEMDSEDVHGDGYIAFYSAENFYRNMRDYYLHIAGLYFHEHGKYEPIESIIKRYPPTCDWITLIVEDIEALSEHPEKMREMMKSLFAFAAKRANIILIGNGDYDTVFAGCEYAIRKMTAGINAKAEDNTLMIGRCDQEAAPEIESVVFESPTKQCDELDFYWDTVYARLKKGYFDYGYFKTLYRDTLEYLIPRVSSEHVYRYDLWLIENIGAMRREKNEDIEGCKPWEFDAAQIFAKGLYEAIVNRNGDNDDFSEGIIYLEVEIKQPEENFDSIRISGSICITIPVSVDIVCRKIDALAEAVLFGTYKGDTLGTFRALNILDEDDGEEPGS